MVLYIALEIAKYILYADTKRDHRAVRLAVAPLDKLQHPVKAL